MNARSFCPPSLCCVIAAALMASACQPAQPKIVPAPPPPSANLDTQVQVNFLASHMDNLAAIATGLPGDSDAQFRSLMHNELDEWITVFPVLVGPDADFQFRQQIAELADCRDRLAAMPEGSNSDAATSAAVRTATQILHGIAQRQPVVDHELFTDVLNCDDVNQRLDVYQGALHNAAVGSCVRQVVTALKRAAAIYDKTYAPVQK
jgi:hypothetical protein